MITRRVKLQLMAFGTLTAIAVSLIFFHYSRIPVLLGVGQQTVTATFSEGAGIYPQANVTYRGVTVGKVTAVRLDPKGVQVDLRIEKSAHLPADVRAVIKSVSAIGEQYVDLIPLSSGGPRMPDGGSIPLSHTSVPVEIAHVLQDVDTVLASVPTDSLEVVLDEGEKAFRGLGPSLAEANTSAQQLINEASANYDATRKLIRDADRALETQRATSPEIRAWTHDLAGFTKTLAANDRQVRELFRSVPPAANQVSGLFDDLAQPLPRLVQSADVTMDLLKAYNKPLEQVLVAYPEIVTVDIGVANHNTEYGLAFKTVANYPGLCSTGWPSAGEPLGPRPSTDITDEAFPRGSYCRIPQGDPRVARGLRNVQCFEPGSPPGRRAATIEQCTGSGYSTTGSSSPGGGLATTAPTIPDHAVIDVLGGFSARGDNQEVKTWQELLLGPLGS